MNIGKGVLVTTALISGIGAVSASASGGDVSVNVSVSGLRNMKGQVMVCLTTNPKAFPDCSKDPASQKQQVQADAAGSIDFAGVTPGNYALSLIHDENANGKLDKAVLIPKEGFGFSRNPAVVFGPPKFKSASFAVGAANVSQAVKMKYMF